MPYRILCFDGGGVRGVYTARLLQRLVEAVPALLHGADLLAGTSTGGLLALGLAAGTSPADLVTFYHANAARIFDRSWSREVAALDGLAGAEYDNQQLKQSLDTIFGTRRLEQLATKVLIPSFQLDNQAPQATQRHWKPKFFHNYPGPDSDGAELVVDVAMRTSAAPIYFPTYQIYIDGGVVANDPSMAALAQALDRDTGRQRLEDLSLCSLGTGANPVYIAGHDLDWGLAHWAKPLVSLVIDGLMGVAEYQCTRLLGDRYFRLQPLLPKPIALDDAAATGKLIADADRVDLTAAVAWLNAHFMPDATRAV
jgi:patatin-like phospholipase/acyl hydrolase